MAPKSGLGTKKAKASSANVSKKAKRAVAAEVATASSKKKEKPTVNDFIAKNLSQRMEQIGVLKTQLLRGSITTKKANQILQNLSRGGVLSAPAPPADTSNQTSVNAIVTVPESINPYEPQPERETEDVGVGVGSKDMVCTTVRFGADHIVGTEKIPLDVGGGKIIHFDSWSVKKCPQGVDPTADIVDKKGNVRKAFNFGGKLLTLPELHRACRKLERNSRLPGPISRSEAYKAKEGEFGIRDIHCLRQARYTKKIYQFSGFSAFIQDVSYLDNNKQIITYTALTITKPKSESAKNSPKNKNKKNYFELNIAISNLEAFIIALEVLMQVNSIKPLPVDDETADDDLGIGDLMRAGSRKRKTRLSKAVCDTDSEEEEEQQTEEEEEDEDEGLEDETDDEADTDVAEEEEEEEEEEEDMDEGEDDEEEEVHSVADSDAEDVDMAVDENNNNNNNNNDNDKKNKRTTRKTAKTAKQ